MEKPEVVKTFRSRIEAEVAKSYLESMGIESSIKSDDADQLYPSLGVVRGVKLLVKDEDLKRALALIEEKEGDS
jgi:hypothetical protein